MRWIWIDRFTAFESGHRAVAVKNVSFTEEQFDDYTPGYPLMPSTLILEGLAQAGGLLVGEHYDFKERGVLAKVGKAIFHELATPGDTLTYTVVIEDIKPDGAIVRGTSLLEGRLQAEVDIVFAHLDDERFQGVDLFIPEEFSQMLRMYRLYDVAKDSEGNTVEVPEHLRAAEREVYGV